MSYTRQPINAYPRTALFGEWFISVLSCHLLLCKIGALITEEPSVNREYFTEHLALHLVNDVLQGVPVDEGRFGWVGVSVHVEIEE